MVRKLFHIIHIDSSRRGGTKKKGKSRHVIQANTVIDLNLRGVKGVSSDEAMLRNGAVLQAVKCWLESSRSFLSWFRQPFHPPTQTGFSYLTSTLFSSFSTYIRLPFSRDRCALLFHPTHLCIIRNVVGSVTTRPLSPLRLTREEYHRPINLALISVVNTICRITLWNLSFPHDFARSFPYLGRRPFECN